MDRRERLNNQQQVMLALLQLAKAEIRVCMPGIIQSFDAAKLTCVVQPAIQEQVENQTLDRVWTKLPLLVDCPVVFPSGGGAMLVFPITEGDECLVVFGDRCMDAWWQSGGVQTQIDQRMHDLSDGYVIPGPRSQTNLGAAVGANAELRSLDGAARIGLNPDSKDVQVQTTGAATVTASTINLNGEVFINGEPYLGHQHHLSPGSTGGVVT